MTKPVRLKFMPSLRGWILAGCGDRDVRSREATAAGSPAAHFKPLRRISVYCFRAVRNRERASRVSIGSQFWRQGHMSLAQSGKLIGAALLAANFAFLGHATNASAQSRPSVTVKPPVAKLQADIPAL